MTKVKKLVAALAAVVAAGAISVTAFAATPTFFFHCSGRGGEDWSRLEKKNNMEQTATVKTTGGYVSSESYIMINIYDDNKTEIVSYTETVTSPDKNYTLDYKQETPRGQGSYNYLHGRAGYNYAEVKGEWTP